MPTEITMPALGPNVETGTLSRWLVREGTAIKSGDVVAEVETDKVTMEIEAASGGILARLLVAEGADRVRVGQAIALLVQKGESLPGPEAIREAPSRSNGSQSTVPEPRQAAQRSAVAWQSTAESAQSVPATAATDGQRRVRIKASPIARRLARSHRVDLSAIQGTGPSGRIVKSDIERAAALQSNAASPMPGSSAPLGARTYAVPDVPHDIVKLTNMRKVIARRLAESKATVPHFYLTVDIKLDSLLKLRSEFNAALDTKLSVNDLLIRALSIALVKVPEANVQFAIDQLYRFQRADVSVAVAIPGGLITPVIRDAGSKHVCAIATEMKDLTTRAREGRLAAHEYQGGTASLSNLGMYGIKQFDAVINPPQGLIVAVGAGEKRCFVVDDALQIATVLSATGSFDHRAIDGATGAEFMAALKRTLEQPLTLLA